MEHDRSSLQLFTKLDIGPYYILIQSCPDRHIHFSNIYFHIIFSFASVPKVNVSSEVLLPDFYTFTSLFLEISHILNSSDYTHRVSKQLLNNELEKLRNSPCPKSRHQLRDAEDNDKKPVVTTCFCTKILTAHLPSEYAYIEIPRSL